MNNSKEKFVREYLQQQQQNTFIDNMLEKGQIHLHHNQLVPVSKERTNNDEIEEFKSQVRLWLKTDNEVKEISSKIKLLDGERKQRKKILDVLTTTILSYMNTNEIDELNSRDGVLKYKKSMIKEPLTKKQIIDKLIEQFGDSEKTQNIINKIFIDRKKVEKQTLRRI